MAGSRFLFLLRLGRLHCLPWAPFQLLDLGNRGWFSPSTRQGTLYTPQEWLFWQHHRVESSRSGASPTRKKPRPEEKAESG